MHRSVSAYADDRGWGFRESHKTLRSSSALRPELLIIFASVPGLSEVVCDGTTTRSLPFARTTWDPRCLATTKPARTSARNASLPAMAGNLLTPVSLWLTSTSSSHPQRKDRRRPVDRQDDRIQGLGGTQ